MLAKIIITLESPDKCTKKQFEEWLRFQLGSKNSMSLENPIVDYNLDLEDNIRSGDYELSYQIIN